MVKKFDWTSGDHQRLRRG